MLREYVIQEQSFNVKLPESQNNKYLFNIQSNMIAVNFDAL